MSFFQDKRQRGKRKFVDWSTSGPSRFHDPSHSGTVLQLKLFFFFCFEIKLEYGNVVGNFENSGTHRRRRVRNSNRDVLGKAITPTGTPTFVTLYLLKFIRVAS